MAFCYRNMNSLTCYPEIISVQGHFFFYIFKQFKSLESSLVNHKRPETSQHSKVFVVSWLPNALFVQAFQWPPHNELSPQRCEKDEPT